MARSADNGMGGRVVAVYAKQGRRIADVERELAPLCSVDLETEPHAVIAAMEFNVKGVVAGSDLAETGRVAAREVRGELGHLLVPAGMVLATDERR